MNLVVLYPQIADSLQIVAMDLFNCCCNWLRCMAAESDKMRLSLAYASYAVCIASPVSKSAAYTSSLVHLLFGSQNFILLPKWFTSHSFILAVLN